MLLLGLTYLTSALVVFFRDLNQVISIVLQVGIWATPIMWNMDTMDIGAGFKGILMLNPLYYIVQGYRGSLIGKTAFWEQPGLTVYFWVFTLVMLLIGTGVFQKLRMHFADVL